MHRSIDPIDVQSLAAFTPRPAQGAAHAGCGPSSLMGSQPKLALAVPRRWWPCALGGVVDAGQTRDSGLLACLFVQHKWHCASSSPLQQEARSMGLLAGRIKAVVSKFLSHQDGSVCCMFSLI
jgi:hypothetical protein